MTNFNYFSPRVLISIISVEILHLLPLYGQSIDFKKYLNSKIEYSDAYIAGNIYQKDFLLFIDILEECHPAFAPESDYPFEIDDVKQTGYQWAGKCSSANDLWRYMQTIAASLNDGHTTLIQDMNLIYPFSCVINDQDIYLVAVSKEYESSLGKQISRINGYPVEEVLDYFKHLVSSDNEFNFKSNINKLIPLYSMWDIPYCLPDSSLRLTFTDATNISLQPTVKNKMNVVSLRPRTTQNELIRQNNNIPFHYTLLPEKDICYFQFNSCIDQSTLRGEYLSRNPNISEKDLEESLSKYLRFDTFLSEMFEEIRKNDIGTLVVDVRNNVGGNSSLCDVLLSWLKPVKDTKVMNHYIRFSEFWKQHYPVLAAEFEKTLESMQQPLEMGKLYNPRTLSSNQSKSAIDKKSEEFFIKNNDESLVFQGNVIFIQGSKTYSSAGLLITTAVDNNIGIVIGNKSSYRPCSYGDMLGWELPNTKIKGSVSHRIITRPNSTKCNESYLLPTVYLPANWADVLDGRDIYWEWILENYEKKISLLHQNQ